MPPANALPDQDTALRTVFDGIYQRVFFDKLASYGIVPQTAADAQALLDMGAQLDNVAESPAVKQAEDAASPFLRAREALSQYVGANGLDPYATKQAADAEAASIRHVARALAQDPAVYNSILVLKAAEAAEAAQYAGQ